MYIPNFLGPYLNVYVLCYLSLNYSQVGSQLYVGLHSQDVCTLLCKHILLCYFLLFLVYKFSWCTEIFYFTPFSYLISTGYCVVFWNSCIDPLVQICALKYGAESYCWIMPSSY